MTKKKRGHPDAEEILARPWCYYCERDFDDLKILISHQKAKHFKCDRCGRRLNTAGGLSVHMNQVHKETLTAVENALPNRSDLSVEIFGMEGIPEDIIQQHNGRVIQQFYEAEAERRATTGNPAPGGSTGAGQPKKPKVESADDLKTRLAAFRAKKAAGEGTATDSGNATPVGAGQAAHSPGVSQSPISFQQPGGPGFMQQPPQYPSQASPPQVPFQQPFGQPLYGMPPQQPPFTQPQSPFTSAPPGFPPQPFPLSIPQFPQFPQPGPMPFQPPPQFGGAGSPTAGPFHQSRTQAGSPLQNGSLPRPPSLPPAPGLPQRPSFAAPPVNAFQMQQLHQGHFSGPPNSSFANHPDPRRRSQDEGPSKNGEAQATSEAQQIQLPTVTASEVDDLIASVTGSTGADKSAPPEPTSDKKAKKEKEKDKAMKLVYSDNEFSPEEKMANLSRYAFNPADHKDETVMANAVEATVTGPVVGQDDVMDTQN